MTDFDQSLWAESRFAQDYRDQAEHIIQKRQELFRILRSFHRFFARRSSPIHVCDLGCGDGALAQQLLEEDPSLKATLIDGSEEMLAAARNRLAPYPNVSFDRKSFAEIIADSTGRSGFDFVVSAFAIHHLLLPDKRALFQTIFQQLRPGGFFLNIDTVFPDHSLFTDWCYAVWQEWVDERNRRLGLKGAFKDIAAKARQNPDNQLSALADQLQALRSAGFQNVECHYKNGLFAIFGGGKAS
ncbi:MAG: class I SAM-dependent methyltransferase [Verrucomicrobiota bacterium]